MKNIHVVPTDKPSRLYVDSQNNICITDVEMKSGNKQHIYITSDEYIGLSYYLDGNLVRKGVVDDKEYWEVRKDYKKIILTTDQDLIKDGVQAIDDEFLEWFVKNPSCEYIQTTELSLFNGDTGESGHYKYEIIIPQVEPKFTTGHQFLEKADKVIVIHRPKQETLEQTAVEWLLDNLISEPYSEEDFNHNSDMWDKAKEMEKQQMFKALIKGSDVHGAFDIELEFKEYYKETFKSE
jgi:hypothetical protein